MKFLLLGLLTLNTWAEYRVYQYYVRPSYPLKADNSEYIVTSSLDPVSYVSYNGGNEVIQVELARTWICPGDTGGFKPYCQSPYGKLLRRTNEQN